MKVGIDAHKKSCTVALFEGDLVTGSFDFPTTGHGALEFMKKVPHGSTIVIETSTTGKVLSRMLLQEKYDVHMVALLHPEHRGIVRCCIFLFTQSQRRWEDDNSSQGLSRKNFLACHSRILQLDQLFENSCQVDNPESNT